MKCPYCNENADYDGDYHCGTKIMRDGSLLRTIICRLGQRVLELETKYERTRTERVAKQLANV